MKKTITNTLAIFSFLLLLDCLPSCTKSNNASAVSLTGTWNGTMTPKSPNPNNYQAGTINMALTQSGSNVTGTFTLTQNAVGGTGNVSGTISGSAVNLTLRETYPTNPASRNYYSDMNLTVNANYTNISGTFNIYDGSGGFYYLGLLTAGKQ